LTHRPLRIWIAINLVYSAWKYHQYIASQVIVDMACAGYMRLRHHQSTSLSHWMRSRVEWWSQLLHVSWPAMHKSQHLLLKSLSHSLQVDRRQELWLSQAKNNAKYALCQLALLCLAVTLHTLCSNATSQLSWYIHNAGTTEWSLDYMQLSVSQASALCSPACTSYVSIHSLTACLYKRRKCTRAECMSDIAKPPHAYRCNRFAHHLNGCWRHRTLLQHRA
jgi:hypothetical protein